MNPLELEERENKEGYDFVFKCLDKTLRGEKVEIKDLVPELKEISNKSYSLFTHPGNPETAMTRPITNIGNVLATGISEYIIFPLELFNTKKDFEYYNGLSKTCGLTFEDFLEHVREGEIKPILVTSPKEYDHSENIGKYFYRDVFEACEDLDYVPPYPSWRVVRLFEEIKLAKIAKDEDIPIEEGWGNKVREKHPKYSMEKCNEDSKDLLDIDTIKRIEKEDFNEKVIMTAGISLFDLRLFGFEGLADIGLEIGKNDPYFGYHILNAYDSYLIRPCVDALFGHIHYDYGEIKAMSFLRVLTGNSEKYWEQILYSSPASSSIIVKHPIKLNIIKKPNRKELKGFLKNREEQERNKCSLDIMNAFNDADLNKVYGSYEKLGEVIEEGINKELESWFEKEKITKSFLRFGSRFIAGSPGLIKLFEGFKNNPELEILITVAGCMASEEVADVIRNINPKDVVKFWAKTWPFTRYGLPFVLWEYDYRKS
ncbi:hypothetical protein C5S32_01255 [ANME-1 cluster archaeon GoMg1]|nr:hypothetical protein [ANME-1 cluster archaeon GoMg1]